jgi:hypothetical protein
LNWNGVAERRGGRIDFIIPYPIYLGYEFTYPQGAERGKRVDSLH